MSVQDEHGYWDSMSEQERNLSDLLKPKEQGKNMSVEGKRIGIEERIKQIQESENYPKYFWHKDGTRYELGPNNFYSDDLMPPPYARVINYSFAELFRSPDFSTFPPPTKTSQEIVKDAFPDSCQTYQPEIWKVKKDTIYAAIGAVEDGLEFAKSCLEEHDLNLGRTTKKNKCWAETIEGSIRHMELTLKLLKDCPENGN